MVATAAEIFDVHINDKWRFIWEGYSIQAKDCYFVMMFAANSENEQELKGREQTIKDISRSHGGTYLPQLAEAFYTKWPTVFSACLPRTRRKPSTVVIPADIRVYNYLLDELIFPTPRFPDVYNKIEELCKKHGISDLPLPPVFDGYPMKSQVISQQTWVAIDDSDPYWVNQFYKLQGDFREWFGNQGGTFQMKVPPLVPDFCWTNQSGTLNLLKSIKSILDPNDILSPGTFELGGSVKCKI
jgi:hypothetical protein